MKISALLFLMCFNFYSYAQNTQATSITEYNYIVGRLVKDLKDGYGIKPNATMHLTNYSSRLSSFDGNWREAKLYTYKLNGVISAYILELKDSLSNYDLRCIPTNQSGFEIKEIARKSLCSNAGEWKSVYISILLDFMQENLN